MKYCPQKEHRNWSDKILFRHGILSTERTHKPEGKDSLSSWNIVHRKNTETGATRFSFVMESCPQNEHRNSSRCLHKHWRGGVYFTTVTPAADYLQYQHSPPFASLQYRQVHSTGKCTALLRSSWFHFETVISVFRLARKMTTKLLHQNSRFSAFWKLFLCYYVLWHTAGC